MEGFLTWLNNWKEMIAAVAGIVSGVAVVWRYLRHPIMNFFRNLRFMYSARTAHNALDRKLDTILLQLIPNGGSSIRDSLDRIEEKQYFDSAFMKAQLDMHAKPLFEADDKGRWRWVNRPFARMCGYQTVEMMGDGWINAVPPECRDKVKAKWDAAIAVGREFDEDVWMIRPDSDVRQLVHIHAYTIRHRNGAPAGYVGEVSKMNKTNTGPLTAERIAEMDP